MAFQRQATPPARWPPKTRLWQELKATSLNPSQTRRMWAAKPSPNRGPCSEKTKPSDHFAKHLVPGIFSVVDVRQPRQT